MNRIVICALLTLGLTSCDDDDFPDFDLVVPSNSITDSNVHMSVYAQTYEGQTDFSVYLHNHHHDGYAQYLRISGDDQLSGQSQDWVASFEAEEVAYYDGPMMVYYTAELASAQPQQQVAISFDRDGSSLIPAEATLLDETVFSVTPSDEPLTMQSSLHVEWSSVDDYQYRLKFVFQCDTSDRGEVGFSVVYPGRGEDELISPFDLDLAQFSAPPSGADSCDVTVGLISKQEQAQSVDEEILYVQASRRQDVLLPIVLSE